MNPTASITGLPGEYLIRRGLANTQSGCCTIEACLVAIALPRLRRAGLLDDVLPGLRSEPELQLYQLLRQAGGDAYSRYNALLRELVSFQHALDGRGSLKLKKPVHDT